MRSAYFVSLVVFSQVARADEPPNRAELAARVEQANQSYQQQKYQDALLIYKDVYLLTKEPSMLFSMGQCYRNLKLFPEAAFAYRSFLKEAPPESEFVPIAQQLLQEVEAQIPHDTPPPPPKKTKLHPLYLGAAITGAASLGAGATSLTTLFLAGRQQNQGNAEQAANLLKITDLTAPIADIAAIVALGLATGGFVLSKRNHKNTAVLFVSPTQTTIALEF